MAAPAFAANPQIGPSGLPLPRFVSLKSDRVNMRQGPSREHNVVWTYVRAGLPVEITAEFETWRRIRDSAGSEGWVQQALLSGRRTALVSPWASGTYVRLLSKPSDSAGLNAKLQSGVLVSLEGCDGVFCRVDAIKAKGYVHQEELWGVYPKEKVE